MVSPDAAVAITVFRWATKQRDARGGGGPSQVVRRGSVTVNAVASKRFCGILPELEQGRGQNALQRLDKRDTWILLVHRDDLVGQGPVVSYPDPTQPDGNGPHRGPGPTEYSFPRLITAIHRQPLPEAVNEPNQTGEIRVEIKRKA